MRSPFYLVGPTAVGKTSLAVEIAERIGAEIVSADAFQWYEGLDVLTAKPSVEERRRVPHYLIGTLPLTAEGSVARFLAEAQACLASIAARGKPAIVVGGSGLYIKGLTHGLSPLPPARKDLRAELDRADLASLLARLCALDPAASDQIDSKNKRRVIRAIEICEATGQPFSASRSAWQVGAPRSDANGLFLTRDRLELGTRIAGRVDGMIAAGVLDGVRAAENEAGFSATSAQIIGLGELRAHLRGEMDLPSCLEIIKAASRRYAKRQMTWFRSHGGFATVDLGMTSRESVITEAIKHMHVDGDAP